MIPEKANNAVLLRSESKDHPPFPLGKESVIYFDGLAFIAMHLIALGGIFYVSQQAILAFIICHYFFVTFGISLAYHRLLSHRSFQPRSPFVRNIFATIGALCFIGGPIFWAGAHRAHHQVTDQPGDPHSSKRGFAWSHIVWVFYNNPNGLTYETVWQKVPDLNSSKYLRFLESNIITFNITVLAITWIVAFWAKRLDLFFWCMPIRLVTVWHSASLVNSYVHGAKFFGDLTRGQIKNSQLVNLIIPGEGFHKNHHDRPNLANLSNDWYQVDLGYFALVFLEKLKILKIVRSKKSENQISEFKGA